MVRRQVIERDDVVSPGQHPVERPDAGDQIAAAGGRRQTIRQGIDGHAPPDRVLEAMF